MIRLIAAVLSMALLAFAACRNSGPDTAQGDSISEASASVHDGKTLYTSCQLCHSNREMQRGPVLDGMEAWYVFEQLKKFGDDQRGKEPKNRGEHLMGTTMNVLRDEQDFQVVADYIANLRPQPSLKTIKGDLVRGRELYASRAGCHGERGEGRPELKSPGLLIQEDWFLLDQLRKYKIGLRGQHSGDTHGQVMSAAVRDWSDRDLKDVTAYLNEL